MKKYIAYFASLLICAVALGGVSLHAAAEQAHNKKDYEQLKANIQKLESKERELLGKLESFQDMLAVCRLAIDPEGENFLGLIEQELQKYSKFLTTVENAKHLREQGLYISERKQYHDEKLKELNARFAPLDTMKSEINEKLAQSKMRESWLNRLLGWFKGKEEAGLVSEERQDELRKSIDKLYVSGDAQSASYRACALQANQIARRIRERRELIGILVAQIVQSIKKARTTYGIETRMAESLVDLDQLIATIEQLQAVSLRVLKLEQKWGKLRTVY
jgi:chromosome segregation ATPase